MSFLFTSFFSQVDAVYYNNLTALSGAVSHSGDEVTGQASGDLSVNLSQLFKVTFTVYIIIYINMFISYISLVKIIASLWGGDFDEMVWAVFAKLPSQAQMCF